MSGLDRIKQAWEQAVASAKVDIEAGVCTVGAAEWVTLMWAIQEAETA